MTRGQLQLHGSPYQRPSCRPLARFDQLGPMREPWWSHHSHPWGNNHKYRRHGRRGHCSPQWLVLHPLVMEALRPPPPSRQVEILRSRRTPVRAIVNFNFFVPHQFRVKHLQRHYHSNFTSATFCFAKWSPRWKRERCQIYRFLQWQVVPARFNL